MENRLDLQSNKLGNFVSHEINPFLSTFDMKESKKLTKISDTSYQVVDKNTHKVNKEIGIVYAKETKFDSSSFTKVYGDLDFLMELSKPGVAVFAYIFKNCLEYGRDLIMLYPKDCIEKTSYETLAPIYKGIGELISSKVIAKHPVTHFYWINIGKFYKGERRYLFLKGSE